MIDKKITKKYMLLIKEGNGTPGRKPPFRLLPAPKPYFSSIIPFFSTKSRKNLRPVRTFCTLRGPAGLEGEIKIRYTKTVTPRPHQSEDICIQ